MTLREVQQYLDSFVNWETRPSDVREPFKLDRIRRLLDRIGNPQNALKVVHVAGSKGKGSTCVFTAHILRCAGYKTGLYTSPHFKDYRERIRILEPPGSCVGRERENNAGIFPDAIRWDHLGAAIGEIRPALEGLRADASGGRLTFFEVYTALALHHFHRQKADFVVLETGLGGRLDATNAVPSLVCAISPLSLEHTDILGGTLGQIAAEKAAIIKDRRQKVVLAPQEAEAGDVLRRRCGEFSIKPLLVGEDICYTFRGSDEHGSLVDFKGPGGDYPNLKVPLLGEHQLVNAATALGIVECLRSLGISVGQEAVSQGLQETFWPGRFEVFGRGRRVVLDGAHNRSSAACLGEGVKRLFPGRRVVLILGVCRDKDRRGIGEALHHVVHSVIATKPRHPRAHDLAENELKEMFPGKECWRTEDIEQAWALAREKAGPEDVVVITGSLFLVAQARDLAGAEEGYVPV